MKQNFLKLMAIARITAAVFAISALPASAAGPYDGGWVIDVPPAGTFGAPGVRGIRVEKPQDLESALTAALRHDGPALVDVVSARQELAMPPKTTIGEAYHFGMFTMQAVLDGRARELIDLAKVNLLPR